MPALSAARVAPAHSTAQQAASLVLGGMCEKRECGRASSVTSSCLARKTLAASSRSLRSPSPLSTCACAARRWRSVGLSSATRTSTSTPGVPRRLESPSERPAMAARHVSRTRGLLASTAAVRSVRSGFAANPCCGCCCCCCCCCKFCSLAARPPATKRPPKTSTRNAPAATDALRPPTSP